MRKSKRRPLENMIFFVIPGQPPCLKNSLRRGKYGNFYHDRGDIPAYFELFALLAPPSVKVGLTGDVKATLRLYMRDRRPDGSNLCATVYDALQHAGVIKNDRQIKERHEFDFYDKLNPRVEIKLEVIKNDTVCGKSA